jgi:hypothetical protein
LAARTSAGDDAQERPSVAGGGSVIRTQIQLTEEQDLALDALAAAEGASTAALVRRAVDLLLIQRGGADYGARRARALAATGMVSGDGAPVSAEHDRFLADRV